MFTHVIVPLDGGPESNVAVTQACVIARLTGASVTLLRVYSGASPTPDSIEFLNSVAREFGDPSVAIDNAALIGNPAEVILDQVDKRQADLVVMRTRGRGGLSRAVLGSVAEGIVKRSPTPVLLLAPQTPAVGAVRTILVPVDGSPGGALALGAARELAIATDARLRLLEVVVPTPMYVSHSLAAHGAMYIDPTWDVDAENGARAYVESLVRRLRSDIADAEGEAVVANSISAAIVRHATEQHADIIAMSSEAHTGAARALLGSVTDAVVRSATCPVLVLRRTASPSEEEADAAVGWQPSTAGADSAVR
jgi:nucleotide-binding universal stress UspA family protein